MHPYGCGRTKHSQHVLGSVVVDTDFSTNARIRNGQQRRGDQDPWDTALVQTGREASDILKNTASHHDQTMAFVESQCEHTIDDLEHGFDALVFFGGLDDHQRGAWM